MRRPEAGSLRGQSRFLVEACWSHRVQSAPGVKSSLWAFKQVEMSAVLKYQTLTCRFRDGKHLTLVVHEARSRSIFVVLTSTPVPTRPPATSLTLSSHSAANLLLVSMLPAARLRRGNPLSSNKDSPHALIASGARMSVCDDVST